MTEIDHEYGLCPLSLIQTLHTNPNEAIKTIIFQSIATYTLKVADSLDDALNNVIYDYFNKRLPPTLSGYIEEFIKAKLFTPDKSYRGFYSEPYNPFFERDQLKELIQCYPDFQTMCTDYHQYKAALKALKLEHGNVEELIKGTKITQLLIDKSEMRFGKDANFMVKIDTLMKYVNDEKTQFEFELLAAYAGIKSLIGQKPFCSTNKSVIVMRMVGAKSTEVLIETLKDPAIKQVYDKYMKRYWFDILLVELQYRKFLTAKIAKRANGKSKLFLSCKLSPNLLGVAISNLLNNNKEKNTKAKIKTLEKAVLSQIRNSTV